MGNFFKDNDDLRFYLERGLDWTPLVELTEYLGRRKDGFETTEEAVDFYKDMLEMIGAFIADEIDPHTEAIDRAGVELVDGDAVLPPIQQKIFKQIKELELHGMCLPRELGGMNAPLVVYLMSLEMFSRADVSVAAHHGFHCGIAMAMLVFSLREGSTEWSVEDSCITKTRFAEYIEEVRKGDAWGCMDITEPGAGSDMAAIRTIGEQDESGDWFVTGQKIFITSGHGKYHFVIARTEKPQADSDDPMAGLGGLSFFLVPRGDEVTIDRLEEKLGHHGSATATLSFEKAPAHLIGERGEGFAYMLTLMNNARLGVGVESLGLMEAAHRLAREYAAERPSMGKTIDKHEMIADYLEQMDTDIRAIRALAMYGAWHEEIAQKAKLLVDTGLMDAVLGDGRGVPGGRNAPLVQDWRVQRYKGMLKTSKKAARRVTPLLKYIASERAVDMARTCIQIHGGNGYTKDYGAEKLLRDAMVMPIYEGTSQIQALMAMKDTLGGIMKDPRGFIRRIAQARWRAMSARDPLERRLAKLQSVSLATQQYLITRTAADKYRQLHGKPLAEWPERFLKNWNPKKDFAFAMLHAERLTRLLADEAICEVLWEQARKFPERRELFERYIERAEPRCRYWHEEITTTGDRLLARLKADEPEVAGSNGERKAG